MYDYIKSLKYVLLRITHYALQQNFNIITFHIYIYIFILYYIIVQYPLPAPLYCRQFEQCTFFTTTPFTFIIYNNNDDDIDI